MKKKIFLTFLIVSALVCLFAISISAATYGESNIYYFDSNVEDLAAKQTSDAMFTSVRDANDVITSYSGSFPKTNANGDAISWYKTGQETVDGNIYVAVSSFVTSDANYATIHNDGRYIFASASGVSKQNIVSLNFPNDMGIKSFSNGSSYGLYAQTGSYTPANSELLFAYFPNTYQITDRAVQATPCLEVYFDPNCAFTTLADVAFYDCRSLRKVVLPTTITAINSNSGTFYSCKNLVEINIADLTNLTTIGKQAFKECDSFVEITLPNSVTTIGERIFENCDNLVKVNFGANLSNLTQSLVYFSTKLQYIYLPNTITSSAGSHALTSSDSKTGYAQSVIFYNGTYDEALALKAVVIANGTGNNQKINHDNFIKWDSTKSDDYYVELAATEKKNYVVYDYNTCEAFYNGIHDIQQEGDNKCSGICANCGLTKLLENPIHKNIWVLNGGEDVSYMSEFTAVCKCEYCETVASSETIAAIITTKGYLNKETGDSGIHQEFKVDKKALGRYAEILEVETTTFGILAGVAGEEDGNPIVADENGKLSTVGNSTIAQFGLDSEYSIIKIKLSGINTNASIYCGAYIALGQNITYISDVTESNKASKCEFTVA